MKTTPKMKAMKYHNRCERSTKGKGNFSHTLTACVCVCVREREREREGKCVRELASESARAARRLRHCLQHPHRVCVGGGAQQGTQRMHIRRDTNTHKAQTHEDTDTDTDTDTDIGTDTHAPHHTPAVSILAPPAPGKLIQGRRTSPSTPHRLLLLLLLLLQLLLPSDCGLVRPLRAQGRSPLHELPIPRGARRR